MKISKMFETGVSPKHPNRFSFRASPEVARILHELEDDTDRTITDILEELIVIGDKYRSVQHNNVVLSPEQLQTVRRIGAGLPGQPSTTETLDHIINAYVYGSRVVQNYDELVNVVPMNTKIKCVPLTTQILPGVHGELEHRARLAGKSLSKYVGILLSFYLVKLHPSKYAKFGEDAPS